MYKAIVFDLDGTLIDSPLDLKAVRKELEIPENDYILEHLGRLPREVRLQKLQILERIEFNCAQQAKAFPGVIELLNRLRASNVFTGIFTRNCRSATDHVVKALGLLVHKVVSREDGPPKPDPAGLKNFLKQWKLKESELLFVGDFRFDIECGKRAGVRTALFTNGQKPRGEWNPDHTFSNYSEFQKFLGLC